jgi:hypothetical protein
VVLLDEPNCALTNKGPGYVAADVGCPLHMELKGLKNLYLVCHPKDEQASCEWQYNRKTLGKTTEKTEATHNTHKFYVFEKNLMVCFGKDGADSLYKKEFSCVCQSKDGSTVQSRTTLLSSPYIAY